MLLHPGRRFMVLDACCVINLYASRRISAILSLSAYQFAVPQQALDEALYVYRGGGGEARFEKERIDLEPLVRANRLAVWTLEGEGDWATFVALAAHLDEGEAAACALAVRRGAAVATDDAEVKKVLSQYAPGVEIVSTPALLRLWAESVALGAADLKRLLLDVQQRGNFSPGKRDENWGWWQDAIKRSS